MLYSYIGSKDNSSLSPCFNRIISKVKLGAYAKFHVALMLIPITLAIVGKNPLS